MNMSFINKIRKLICHRQYINPIVDENIYQDLEKSYSGGSLSESKEEKSELQVLRSVLLYLKRLHP